jgi:hypothetical protein
MKTILEDIIVMKANDTEFSGLSLTPDYSNTAFKSSLDMKIKNRDLYKNDCEESRKIVLNNFVAFVKIHIHFFISWRYTATFISLILFFSSLLCFSMSLASIILMSFSLIFYGVRVVFSYLAHRMIRDIPMNLMMVELAFAYYSETK